MAATVLGSHGSGNHAGRPAANTVPDGSLYSCTTHSLVYVSSYAGNSWATWASLTGTGLADPMTTRGDIIYRNASNATDRLALPLAGQVIGRSGSDLAAVYPPGYEFDYVEFTSAVNVTATAEATPTTIVTGNAVTYDGSTAIWVEFFVPDWFQSTASSLDLILLYDGSTSLGRLAHVRMDIATASDHRTPISVRRKVTPSAAAHTFSIRGVSAGATAQVDAGAGGATTTMPGYIRQTKA